MQTENADLDLEIDTNQEFVRSNWSRLERDNKGKILIVAQGRLQGVFASYGESKVFAKKRYRVALVFEVNEDGGVDKIIDREIDFGTELEV